MNYWLWRLYPLVNRKENPVTRKFVFLCADKVGKDDKTTYVGTTCAIKVNPVQLVKNLDKKSEGYLLCEL